jgi:hypothetical protein
MKVFIDCDVLLDVGLQREPDFEDAMQVAAAERFGAQVVATRNLKHYKQSPIRAIVPTDLLTLLD